MTEQAEQSPVPFNEVDPMLLEVQRTGRVPQTWWANPSLSRAMERAAKNMAASSMVPADYRGKWENVMVAFAAGLPLGLSMLACVQSVAVINGRPTLWGDAVMAQVLAHPSLVQIHEDASGTIEGADRKWEISITRKLPSGMNQQIVRSFSVADAKSAGLWKKAGPWSNYPDRMIYNRARAYALRDCFADVLGGVTLAADNEEVVRDITVEVRDAPASTTVDESPGLANDVPAPAKPKAKRVSKKQKVADEQAAAEAAAALSEANANAAAGGDVAVKEKLLVSAKEQIPLRGWCRTFDDLVEGGVRIDAVEDTVHLCNGEGWREVKPEEGVLYSQVCDHLSEHMAKFLTKECLSRRMDQTEAMEWAKSQLDLKKAPAKFLALTHTQLAELVRETE